VNHDESFMHQYQQHFVNLCPWRTQLSSLPKFQLHSTYLDFDCKQDTFYQSEFYNDWAKPQDIAHGLCGTIYQNDESTVQLMFQRTHDQDYFDHDVKNAFNGLVPFIRRTFQLQERLQQFSTKGNALETATDICHSCFMIFDTHGRLYHMTDEAENTLENANCLIKIKNHRLHFDHPEKQSQWEHFFRSPGIAKRFGRIELSGVSGEICLDISRLPDSFRAISFLSKAEPMIVVHVSQSQPVLLNQTYLKEAYQITPSEGRIAQGLVNGLSLNELSDTHHVSINTLRTQAKSLLKKTGCANQAKLIVKLLQSPFSQIR
jgi:DNA-binding CsgD family transcriptional regulator